jgi:predicted transcriptional regulator
MYDDNIQARAPSSLTSAVDEIAEESGRDQSEVIRRLIRLGIMDCEQCGTEAALAVGERLGENDG